MAEVKKGYSSTFRLADGNVVQFEQYGTLPSTIALAREYAKNGYPDKYVVFSQKQGVAENAEEKKIEVESLLQIDSGIEQFHATLFDDDVTILYYSREYLLSYYCGGTNQKIGYYPEINFLNVNYRAKSPVFTVCAPDRESKNQPVYAVYFIHEDSYSQKKWREDLLVRSNTPFIACSTLDVADNFYMLLSGNVLQLLTIKNAGM